MEKILIPSTPWSFDSVSLVFQADRRHSFTAAAITVSILTATHLHSPTSQLTSLSPRPREPTARRRLLYRPHAHQATEASTSAHIANTFQRSPLIQPRPSPQALRQPASPPAHYSSLVRREHISTCQVLAALARVSQSRSPCATAFRAPTLYKACSIRRLLLTSSSLRANDCQRRLRCHEHGTRRIRHHRVSYCTSSTNRSCVLTLKQNTQAQASEAKEAIGSMQPCSMHPSSLLRVHRLQDAIDKSAYPPASYFQQALNQPRSYPA